jgi:hypothetical protein
MSACRVLLLAIGVTVANFATIASAEPFIESREPSAYRVRIVNDMGYPIRVKIMGFRQDAHFVIDLDEGEATTQKFFAGQRVVCVWNRNRRLRMAASVDFDRSGVMRLQSHDHNAFGADRSRGNEAGMPMLRLEKE